MWLLLVNMGPYLGGPLGLDSGLPPKRPFGKRFWRLGKKWIYIGKHQIKSDKNNSKFGIRPGIVYHSGLAQRLLNHQQIN